MLQMLFWAVRVDRNIITAGSKTKTKSWKILKMLFNWGKLQSGAMIICGFVWVTPFTLHIVNWPIVDTNKMNSLAFSTFFFYKLHAELFVPLLQDEVSEKKHQLLYFLSSEFKTNDLATHWLSHMKCPFLVLTHYSFYVSRERSAVFYCSVLIQGRSRTNAWRVYHCMRWHG